MQKPYKLLVVMKTLSCIGILLASLTVNAQAPKTHWYRYYNDGIPTTSKTLTDQHIKNGYEELDAGFRVIKQVAPYSKAKQDKINALKEAEEAKKAERRKLFDTYGSSERAMRKRKQLLSDIHAKKRFAQQQLTVANNKLQAEISKAASLEKNGKKIPDDLKRSIDTNRQAVKVAKNNFKSLMKQQLDALSVLTHDIRKLRKHERELSGIKP